MLVLAVNAQLPLIAVSTRDVMNLPEVLRELTGRDPYPYDLQSTVKPGKLYWMEHPGPKVGLPYAKVYTKMMEAQSSLLIVNPPALVEPMFSAGEVPVPRSLIVKFLNHITSNEKKSSELAQALGGCTIKEVDEFARLTMARDTSLTPLGLMTTRKTAFQEAQGLTIVDANQSFYAPPEPLVEWSLREKPFFLNCDDMRLIPRGLLLDGPPGTGKTAASKWIAKQFGVPLYRVDVGGTKNKYVGQSEANMLANLSRLDHEEPCIALFDEIEKVFATANNDTSGTTSTMLSQLLWWLAERRSRVLVIMTTNDYKKLPQELHREGRIDKHMWFGGLELVDAPDFVQGVLSTFKTKFPADAVKKIVAAAYGDSKGPRSQAVLTERTYAYVKAQINFA